MKNFCAVLVIMILFISNINGQNNTQSVFDRGDNSVFFGLKAGVNYSNIYDSEGESFEHDQKFGFAGGIFLTIPIGDFLGVQPEVLFSQKGYKANGVLFDQPFEITRTSNYIDVPLLVSLRPISFLSIVAGPQYSFLLNQTDEFKNEDITIEQKEAFNNEDLRKNTVCFTGGIDVNIRKYVVGARIGWDLFKNNGESQNSTPRYKNTWVQVTMGYRL